MPGLRTESLYARIERQEQAAQQHWGVFVPVDDSALYCTLVREMAQALATSADHRDLVLFVDAATAERVEPIEAARLVAAHFLHFGDTIPQAWAVAPETIPCEFRQDISASDHFFVAVSSNLSFILAGSGPLDGSEPFKGGWSDKRGVVERAANMILNAIVSEQRPALPPPGPHHAEQVHACSLRLMTQMVQWLASRQRNIVQDKDDLFSVLNILKAISAKRRAHEILYTFVHQIARVVEMVRCSVVRVWETENTGHVLASHEDPSVRDLTIDLRKYPELQHALETRHKVVVNDVLHESVTLPFARELRQSGITSLIVIPIVLFDPNVGSFLLRAARSNGPFASREISFCEIVAEAAANALERAYLFESVQRANERLELLAVTDGLTGLYNHRFFRERLDEEFERAKRYSLPLSCLILDIDDFKRVNDRFGHLAGDGVLREIALRTSQMVRKSDVVARYGGEELVVIMPQTGARGAKAEAERIRKEINARPYDPLPEGERVSASIGVAVYNPESMVDCEGLIRAADNALYRAKREGKNRVVLEGEE